MLTYTFLHRIPLDASVFLRYDDIETLHDLLSGRIPVKRTHRFAYVGLVIPISFSCTFGISGDYGFALSCTTAASAGPYLRVAFLSFFAPGWLLRPGKF